MDAHERQLDIQPVIDWLIEGARPAMDAKQTLSLLCRRMHECGLRLDRLAVFVRPLHPNVVARAYYWRQGSDEVEQSDEEHGFMDTDEALTSPIRAVRDSHQEIRRRLAGPGAADDFPVLAELRADGLTDYLIAPLEFLGGEVHVVVRHAQRRRLHTSESNARFDAMLRSRDPASGLRSVEDIVALAARNGLQLEEDNAMPANNRLLVFSGV
jgi:adenylate cyclase